MKQKMHILEFITQYRTFLKKKQSDQTRKQENKKHKKNTKRVEITAANKNTMY